MIYHPVVAIWWFWIQFRYGSCCWCCFCVFFCKWCGKWYIHITCIRLIIYVLHEQMKSWSEVGHFRLFVLGFRGDWKALVAMFNLIRNYNTDKVRIFLKQFGLEKTCHWSCLNFLLISSLEGLLALQRHKVCWRFVFVFDACCSQFIVVGHFTPNNAMEWSTFLFVLGGLSYFNGRTGFAPCMEPWGGTWPFGNKP